MRDFNQKGNPAVDISLDTDFVPRGRDTGALGFAQIVKVLKRHSILIVALALAAAAAGFMYARSVPKTYTASTTIAIEGDRLAIPELQGALRSDSGPDPMPIVRTEVQALTSRALIEEVIGELKLDQVAEFNPALRPPAMMDRAKDWMKSLFPQGSAADGPAAGPDDAVYQSVSKSLSTFQDNRSLVIALGFNAEDPRLASNFLNTLVQDYLRARAARRADANRGANDVLTQRIAQVRSDLNGLEKQMSDMRSRSDIVALRAGSVGQQQVEELASATAKASVDRAQLEANWNRANDLIKHGNSAAMAGVLDSPTVSRLRDQESVASSRVADLSSRYGPNYPGVRSAAADLGSVRSQLGGEIGRIVASLGAQLKAAQDKEAELNRALNESRRTGVKAENARAQLDQLQQEVNTRRALYQTLLQSEQQTAAQPKTTEAPDVRVLSAAVAPGAPSGPNTKMIVGMGGMSGALLGCMLALLRLRSVDGFDSPTDVTRATGLMVLATFDHRMLRRGLSERVLRSAVGPEVQALRSLRDRIRYAARNGTPRTVMFSSTHHLREAAELAIAVARSAAAAGEQVLLVEASLEQPTLARLLDVGSDAMGAVLQEGADWRDTLAADPLGPLDVLLSTRKMPGSVGLLSGVTLQNLLVEVRQHYDLVVLSGANAATAAAEALVSRVDLTVLVLDGKAGNPAAQAAVSRLSGQGRGALASVLVG